MSRSISVLLLASLLICRAAMSQTNLSTKSNQLMSIQKNPSKPIQQFFEAFGKGDVNATVNSFDEHCKIIAVRDRSRKDGELYGTYLGKEGVMEFLSALSNTFNTKAFSIQNIIGEGDISFANGSFTHEVKSTGKLYSSDWSLMCKIKDNKILEYHFYEDTAVFSEASK